MFRKFLIPLVAAAFLAAPAFAPVAMPGVSDSAMAANAKSGTAKRKFITKDLPAGRTKKRIFDRWGNLLTVRKAGKDQVYNRMGGGGGKGTASAKRKVNVTCPKGGSLRVRRVQVCD